ncbi:helix-turn-helix domain-containing protein [Agrobacterium sp. CCNWLW71]|uniref:helix-turn-helix domain-containing protein n=1 Tax=unclassified Agrobacterium TaxID=2632611 RepID=UPI002FEE6B25
MSRPQKQSSRVWRWRRAIGESDLPATTRDILRVLSEFMGENGDSCFPSVSDVSQKSGRDRKTVREHLSLAENRGWLVVESAGFSGPQHARKAYVARWPDGHNETGIPSPEFDGSAPVTDGEYLPGSGGDVPSLDGVDFPTYNTSPQTSPNNSPEKNAGAGARSVLDRVKIRRQFLRWLPSIPGYENHSDASARAEWLKLSDSERRECIRLTPAYVRWIGKGAMPSPANILRDRAWEKLPSTVTAAKPELIEAKSFSPLWMTTRFSMLLQPPTGSIVITAFDRGRIANGMKTEDETRREKLAAHGWPAVNEMMADMRAGKPYLCPAVLEELSSELKSVKRDSDLFAAWARLHDRRGWPFFTFTPNYVPLPAVDLGITDLNAAVDAAMENFETLISKV